MKKFQKGTYVPATTLNAIKNLLFSDNGVVDLSGIVDDLCPAEEVRDITAINVALAYRKTKLDFDMTPRVVWNEKVFTPVKFSIIHGVVSAIDSENNQRTFNIEEWENFKAAEPKTAE